MNIPMSQLIRSPIQLRPVRKETVDYLMLRDGVRDVGIILPLLVRPCPKQQGIFEVVDGGHRFECALDLLFKEVPCIVRELESDSEVRRFQVMANANQITTRPVDYIRSLQRMVNSGEMTVDELSFSIHKHPDWVRRLLSLNNLSIDCKKLLDSGNLSCTIGIQLAKLPVKRQDELLSLHSQLPSAEYLELIREEVRDFRSNKVRDRSEAKYGQDNRTFRPIRKVKYEHIEKIEKGTILARYGAVTASEGWDAAFDWILSVDPHTVKEREARKERGEKLVIKRSRLRDLEFTRRKLHGN